MTTHTFETLIHKIYSCKFLGYMIFEISRGKKVHIVYTIPAKHYVRLLKDFIMKIKKTYSLVFFIYFFTNI